MVIKIAKFLIYGKNNPKIQERIQKTLPWRSWDELDSQEKQNALQLLENHGFLSHTSILNTIYILNMEYLRNLYGKELHYADKKGYPCDEAAKKDFCRIFLTEKQDVILVMLSVFANLLIDKHFLDSAEKSKNNKEKKEHIKKAFRQFDRFETILNRIFNQFSINQKLTRIGFVPCQEKKIMEQIYIPTLEILSDSKWKLVNDDLKNMFQDYREGNYKETITKAHSVLHRFLQVLLNTEKRNSKGEIGKLFNQAKKIIPDNNFIKNVINTIQKFVSSERTMGSTAKPSLKETTSSDALLMMNVVMIFLQYCLKKT